MAADKYKEVTMSRKDIFINNLLGGISWGLGATVGTVIILAFFGFVLSQFDTVPLVGKYIQAINTYVQTAKK